MKKSEYEKYFRGKKITIMGLGLLGRSIQVAEFLASCGASLTITDLKSKKELTSSVAKLRRFPNIKYTLGGHDLKDFERCDMVVKSAGVPMDSEYIRHARKNGIEIAMDASLFAKIAKEVRVVGVTGTRGKSMTTSAIYHTLKSNEKRLKSKIYVGGNLRGMATLPLLKKVTAGDIVVLELDSWQCQGFGDEKLSPNVAVFTSFMTDHMNYYNGSMKDYFADKENIFKFQKKGDLLVVRPDMKKLIPKTKAKGKYIVASPSRVKKVNLRVFGNHQIENMACVYEVAKWFGLPDKEIKKSLESFEGLEGRMQLLKVMRGVKIYNDNNATTPDATKANLEAIGTKEKNIILIAGGNDKNIPLEGLAQAIKKYTKRVYFLPGTGTHRYLKDGNYQKDVLLVKDLKEAVKLAVKEAKRGDTIMFSPAFSSFSQYANEYERNDEFVKLIRKLK